MLGFLVPPYMYNNIHSVRNRLGPNYWEMGECPIAFSVPCFYGDHRHANMHCPYFPLLQQCFISCRLPLSTSLNCKQRTFSVRFSFFFSMKWVVSFPGPSPFKEFMLRTVWYRTSPCFPDICKGGSSSFSSQLYSLGHTLFCFRRWSVSPQQGKTCN